MNLETEEPLTDKMHHYHNTTFLQNILVPVFIMLVLIAFIVFCMFGVVSIHSVCALASGKCRKRHHEDEEEDEEEVEDEEEDEMKAQKGMGHLLRELYDLGFVIPFATACGMLAGVHSLWLNSDGVCQPLQLNDDTGLKYIATLLSFMIMFRFNQLYIGAVTARSHVETTLIALRTVAVHIRGMASPKAALWTSEQGEHLRTTIAHRLVYMYAVNVFNLRNEGLPSDQDLDGAFAKLQDNMSRIVLGGMDRKNKHNIKSALVEEAALLNLNFQELVDEKMIVGTPAQYGQLVGKTAQFVTACNASDSCLDIFPGGMPYPRTITFIARIMLLYFCVCASAVIGCNTSHLNFYTGQVFAFFVAFSYCGLFELCSAMENPFGHDLNDFTLDHYGVALAYTVGKVLQLPAHNFPQFPVSDTRFPNLKNRKGHKLAFEVPIVNRANAVLLGWTNGVASDDRTKTS